MRILRSIRRSVGWWAGPGLLGALATAASLNAQAAPTLSLADAMREADRHAFANRIAIANNDAGRAQSRLPLKGILPTARIETGVIRTTDPIGAFGTTLRQRLVTPAAFDPARLNDPAAVTNVQGGLVLELPLLNADAWTGWRAARASAEATGAAGEWTSLTTKTNLVRAYYGATLAHEKSAMLEQAQRAAESAVRQVQAMVNQGLVTKADALQASVRASDVASQLLSARSDALSAAQQVSLLLGRTDGRAVTLPATLPPDAPVRALAEHDTVTVPDASHAPTPMAARADVRAASAGVRAANADRLRAASTLLPRVNSFARYDWNNPTTLYGGRKNWTVGVMASWSLFGGGSELADLAGATAREIGAQVGREAALAQGQLEADAARRGIVVALQQLDLAKGAAEQSREAYRLVDKRYAGGLATIAELLGAESQATGAALAHAAARYTLIDAIATHRRAIGADPAELAFLDTAR
ncbi:MAG: TolC family protein [Gemmatimonadaceae bacterium]|nr:TolC family protein [Gemmatimonadaceae bacterium]